jgi:FixJ family two-component response regulator
MKQKINVLVIEDNEYYNSLILNALRQSIHFVQSKMKYQMVLHSFIDSSHFMKQIESHEFIENNVIAFVDQYMGNGISGSQIIKQLKNENSNTFAVLLSQSPDIEERSTQNNYDFCVIKDTFAPALCRLFLDQFIENKFL